MARQRARVDQPTGSNDRPAAGRPLRRATDPTLLLGAARPLTLGAAVAAIAGSALAVSRSTTLAPLAFAVSSVVAVGLLAAARRTDILARPDFAPDRSTRTRRVFGAILVLAVLGTAVSAWTITAEWFAAEATEPVGVQRRTLVTALLTLVGLGLPLGSVWLLDFLAARFRPARRAVVADLPIAVRADGTFHRSDTETVLLVSNDMFSPAQLRRGRRVRAAGLTFSVHNPSSPLRPPVGTVFSSAGPVVASGGVVLDGSRVMGRVPLNLRDTWVFELDHERTRHAALDPTAPDFQAAYGRLVLLRASTEADPIDLSGLPRRARRLARRARTVPGGGSVTAQEMLEFVDLNVSAPRDLPRAKRVRGDETRVAPVGTSAYEFVGFEGAITFDDFDDLDSLDEHDEPHELVEPHELGAADGQVDERD